MDASALAQRKQNANLLASQYTSTKRAMELGSISAFVVLLSLSTKHIWDHITVNNAWVVALAVVLSMVLADLFSGLVHWAADTWGGVDTPFVGKTFIRSFREHHVDPQGITRHDVVETNGDNCLTTLPALALLAFAPIQRGNLGELFLVTFLLLLCIMVSLTNQFHKWAHQHKPPAFAQFLMDSRIILSRKNHQVHHHTPFDRYYCITTGWLNPVLGSIGFWKRTETVITHMTGAVPRVDDAKWTIQN